MNFIQEFIAKIALKKALGRLLMLEKLRGHKTYITAVTGILVVLVGMLFGPVEVGSVSIPHFDLGEGVKLIWNGLLVIFVRAGIKSGV